jgi:Cu(I)/Ag(I) efflux system membrane protein CusA/SilA
MNEVVSFPGVANAWPYPIENRLNMLSTGIKTPVGIKVAGPDLAELERVASEIEAVVKTVPNTTSVFAERTMGGNYIEFHINRDEIARYGLTVGAVQDVLEVAVGGMPLTTTVEGLERYAINLRYSRDFRESIEALREIIVPTASGAQVPLGQLARIEVVHAPMGIKSEAAVPNAWIYVDVKGTDLGTYVRNCMLTVNEAIGRGTIRLPAGYNIFWSGQYEYMQRARQRLTIVVPLTLLIIILIIYLNTRSAIKTAIVLLAVPFSLVGAFWILYLLHYNLSVAVWVGRVRRMAGPGPPAEPD